MKEICFILVLICVISCSSKHDSKNILQKTIEYHNLNHYSISDLFPEIIKKQKYILLTGENKEFLFAQIDHIQFSNHKIYIQDSKTKSLLVFDSTGQGITKVGSFGRGPGEYTNIASFDIDRKGNVYIVDGQQDKLNIYDSNYVAVRTLLLPYETDIITCLPNGHFLLGLSSWNGETKKQIVLTDSSMNILNHFGEYANHVDNDVWLFNYQFTKTEDHIVYNRPMDNDIYLFDKNGNIQKIITFDFSSNNIPDKAKRDVPQYWQYFDDYYLVGNLTFSYKNYLGGNLLKHKEMKFYMLDTLKNAIYSKPTDTNTLETFLNYQENHIISYLDPSKFSRKHSSSNLSPEIQKHLEEGNFVICIYELK